MPVGLRYKYLTRSKSSPVLWMGKGKGISGFFFVISDMPPLCQEGQRTPLVPSQTGLDAKMTQRLVEWTHLTAEEKVSVRCPRPVHFKFGWTSLPKQGFWCLWSVQPLVSIQSLPAKQAMPGSTCGAGAAYPHT